MYEWYMGFAVNNNAFGDGWGDSPLTVTRDYVTRAIIDELSDQNLVIHSNPCIILFLAFSSGSKTQTNRWKLPWIDSRALVASVGCGIVTSRKHLLWRHFDLFVFNCVTSSHRRQFDYHSLIIKSDSQHFYWFACKKHHLETLEWHK